MAEGYIEAIQKAFDIALHGFGTDEAVAVALENIGAPTDTSKPYLAGYLIPAQVEQADLSFTESRAGIYQIDINNASHVGSAPSNQLADKLNAAFRPGATLTRSGVCVTITGVSPGPLIVNNGWATRPLSINWITHTKRL